MTNSQTLQQKRDYERFNLSQNPFPYSPVPDEAPVVFTGQDHVKSELANVLGTAISTGKSNHLVITGKYGNGKSHSLKHAKNMVQTSSDSIVGYVAQPGDSFLDIYHEFMYDLGHEFFQDLAHEYLAKVVSEHDIETEREINGADDMRAAIDNGEVILSDIIPLATRELKDISKFTDFSRALVHLVYEETSLYAWQWLSGEGLRYEQRKKMEIHTDIDDDSKAVKAFTSIKKLFQALDYGVLCLFIDEFESIARLKPKKKQSVLNSLRHVMDRNPDGISILIACAPEVWQDVMSEYHAFSERIGNEVALRPFDEDQIESLIEDYLSAHSLEEDASPNPYTEAAIQTLLKKGQGNIRRTISLCGRALDNAIDAEKTEIDQDCVEKALSN
ncbi:ATPase [Halobacteriales archaeon QH_7_66_36]|nr:MAG: ATPase [Halobacteriales archaeon QH_7_66_36]